MLRAIFAHTFKFLFNDRDLFADTTTVILKRGFAGTSGSDTTTLTRKGFQPCADHAGHLIQQLCKFYLKFSFKSLCTLGKDIKDQLIAINHADLHSLH
ncbi:hypothetical protein D3C72_1589140 [compost metagenome]